MAGKHGNGEGSIRQREDGIWEARISLGYHTDGKPLRKSIYGKTRREVADKLAHSLRDYKQGLPVATDERQTVGAFLTQWLEEVKKPVVKPKTYHSYSQVLRVHLIPGFRGKSLGKLSPQHVQTFLNAKSKEGLSPRTVGYLREVLRGALNQAIVWGLITRNAAALASPPKAVGYSFQPLSEEGCTKLLEAVKGTRYEALYLLSLSLGLRQGEALALRWSDIDLAEKSLCVRSTVARIGKEWVFGEPKSANSKRILPIPDFLLNTLMVQKERLIFEKSQAESLWHDNNLVFPSEVGTPIEARNLLRHFHQTLKEAGLPSIRWHDLRHTTATLLLNMGVPGRTIMEILGHSQISLTLNTYAHPTQKLTREAIDALGNRLNGTG